MRQAPEDTDLKEKAAAAEQRAKSSAEEAGLCKTKPESASPVISLDLKQAYRRAVKLIHPDLAITERERQRRTELMALVNLAYERGDKETINKIIEDFGHDPEAIVGEDTGSQIVKAIRRIAQLRRRLKEIEKEIEDHYQSELFRLRKTAEKAEAMGDDPLGDLAKQLIQEISERKAVIAERSRRAH